MNKEQIQQYLKELKTLQFKDTQYQEIIGQQRILINTGYVNMDRFDELIGFCHKYKFDFDVWPSIDKGQHNIRIEIIDKKSIK